MYMENKIIKLFEKTLQTILANPSFIPQIRNFQKLTPKDEARQKKILKAYELREKKRRSKKKQIIMI